MKKDNEKIEDLLDITCSALDFAVDIAESAIDPIVEYGLGSVPVINNIYGVFKKRQFENRVKSVIKELTQRQERLERIMSTLEDRIEFGDNFINYLDLILLHEYDPSKIKYYIELLITSHERKKYISYEEQCLNTLISLSSEEIETLFRIRDYVVDKLDVTHMVDIMALNAKRMNSKSHFSYNVVEQEAWFGYNEIGRNRKDISMRLVSYGFIEPRYAYYGKELEIARFVMNESTFKFCDFIELYSGKMEDSFLVIWGHDRHYESVKYDYRVNVK